MEPRQRSAVSLATIALLALTPSCSSDSADTGGLGPAAIGSIVKLTDPQVDLPGRITVFFQVRGTNSRPVAGLTEADFQLEEGQSRVSATESSQRLLTRPQTFRSLSLLLLDRSNSVTSTPEGRQAAIDAAKEYILRATESANTNIALAWFDGQGGIRPVLDDQFQPTGFSSDREYLLEAIDNLHIEPVGSTSTNLYGAILSGFDRLDAADNQAAAEGVVYRDLTLVTFTDGTDQAGLAQLAATQTRVDSGRYNAFTIGLGSEVNPDVLRALGKDGFATAARLEDLATIFQSTATTVRDLANSFYLLAYCSPKQDGSGTHTLTVRAGGGNSEAAQIYEFSADFFSGGCGFLDTTAIEPELGERHEAKGVIEDADGNLFVFGDSTLPASPPGNERQSLFVARCSPDGRLDATFGALGVLRIPDVQSLDFLTAADIALAPDGTILLACSADTDSDPSGGRIAVLRMATDGNLLAANALPLTSATNDFANALAVDSSGRTVISGISNDNGVLRTAIWRLDPSLLLDAAFGQGGRTVFALNASNAIDTGTALAIDGDDSIVCVGVGTSQPIGESTGYALRLTPTGALSPTFGQNGVVRLFETFASAERVTPRSVAIDGTGRIVIAGYSNGVLNPEAPTLFRLSATGLPDSTFAGLAPSGTGQVLLPNNLTENPRIAFGGGGQILGLHLREDGNIFACGQRPNGQGHSDLAVWNFNEFGRLVPSYNGTGFVIEDGSIVDDGAESGNSILITSTGRIVVAGSSTSSSTGPTGTQGRAACLWTDGEKSRVFAPFGTR
ncbi:MAG: hypothetical protein AB8H80_02365 [Planctomycetota bacterium]